MHPRTHLAVTSCLAAFAATLPAQLSIYGRGPGGSVTEDFLVSPRTKGWHLAAPAEEVHKALAARLTGHIVPDVMLQCGSVLYLATAPGMHSSLTDLAGGSMPDAVVDFAVLRGGGAGGLDALALIGARNGLEIMTLDASGTPQIASVSLAWSDVELVSTHPDDPGVIFGLDVDTALVRVALLGGTWADAGSFSVNTQNAIAIQCIRWRDTAARVAVFTDDRVEIRTRTGATEAWQYAALGSPALTGPPLRPAAVALVRALGTESLAWIVDPGTSLAVVTAPATASASPLAYESALGGNTFVALAAGDISLEGNDDLILSRADNDEVTALVNVGSTSLPAAFLHLTNTAIRLAVHEVGGAEPAGVVAPTVVADFDGDGDGDVYATVDVVNDDYPTATLVRPRFMDAEFQIDYEGSGSAAGGAAIVGTSFWLKIPAQQWARVPSTSSATHVEIAFWVANTVVGSVPPYPIGLASPDPALRLIAALQPTGDSWIDIPFQSIALPANTYSVLVRPVTVDSTPVTATTEVDRVGRAFTALAVLRGGGAFPNDAWEWEIPPAPPYPPRPPRIRVPPVAHPSTGAPPP